MGRCIRGHLWGPWYSWGPSYFGKTMFIYGARRQCLRCKLTEEVEDERNDGLSQRS